MLHPVKLYNHYWKKQKLLVISKFIIDHDFQCFNIFWLYQALRETFFKRQRSCVLSCRTFNYHLNGYNIGITYLASACVAFLLSKWLHDVIYSTPSHHISTGEVWSGINCQVSKWTISYFCIQLNFLKRNLPQHKLLRVIPNVASGNVLVFSRYQDSSNITKCPRFGKTCVTIVLSKLTLNTPLQFNISLHVPRNQRLGIESACVTFVL